MWQSFFVIFVVVQTVAATSSQTCLKESNATAGFTDTLLTDATVCCTTCSRCTNEDCCGYSSVTRTCYYCTSGTCCGSVSNPDSLGCCDEGTECCLNCKNSTFADGLYCGKPGNCSCSPTTNTCVDGECCPSQYVCGGTCCTSGVCCDGVCCESGVCCDGQCCDGKSDKCCYDTQNYDGYCCGPDQTCCDGACCSTSQKCLTDFSFYSSSYCCNADLPFEPSACTYNSDCPGWLNEDSTCCYGCCCPGNYTCDSNSRQCIYDRRKNILGNALGIGLGYGLGLGLLIWILWCCIKGGTAHSSHDDFIDLLGSVSLGQWFLVLLRIIWYAVYPYTDDFSIAIAAVSTGFWLCATGVIIKRTRIEGWVIIYMVLFLLTYSLNLACLVFESSDIQKEPMFFVVLSTTGLVVLIDTIWAGYFVRYGAKQFGSSSSSSSSSASQPLIQKRNQVECCDVFKPKGTVSALSSMINDHTVITQHFYNAWVKGSHADVNIHAILKVKHPRVSAAFRNYKKKVSAENEGQPNVMHMFHATKLSARCKVQSSNSLCKNADCSVCGIARKGFKISHSGLNINFARFGRGIYFAPNSSKANDYNSDQVRAMFYCKVVMGNRWETEYDKSDLKAPPTGYHSVYGKVGARLNYPEVVVYTEDAVKATHLILYSVGGVV